MGANSSIYLLRELTLQELLIDWAKLEAVSIGDLVYRIGINLIDTVRSLPFRSEFFPYLVGGDDWSSQC